MNFNQKIMNFSTFMMKFHHKVVNFNVIRLTSVKCLLEVSNGGNITT